MILFFALIFCFLVTLYSCFSLLFVFPLPYNSSILYFSSLFFLYSVSSPSLSFISFSILFIFFLCFPIFLFSSTPSFLFLVYSLPFYFTLFPVLSLPFLFCFVLLFSLALFSHSTFFLPVLRLTFFYPTPNSQSFTSSPLLSSHFQPPSIVVLHFFTFFFLLSYSCFSHSSFSPIWIFGSKNSSFVCASIFVSSFWDFRTLSLSLSISHTIPFFRLFRFLFHGSFNFLRVFLKICRLITGFFQPAFLLFNSLLSFGSIYSLLFLVSGLPLSFSSFSWSCHSPFTRSCFFPSLPSTGPPFPSLPCLLPAPSFISPPFTLLTSLPLHPSRSSPQTAITIPGPNYRRLVFLHKTRASISFYHHVNLKQCLSPQALT